MRRALLLLALVACPLLALTLIVPWIASRLLLRAGSHSILEAIAEPFESVVELGEEVVEGAESAFNAIMVVWDYLKSAGNLLAHAWDWLINGVYWFASQAEEWASETLHTVEWVVTRAIPEAAEWVYRHTILWALREIERLWRKVVALLTHLYHWALRELHRLYQLAAHWVDRLYKWAHHAVWWIEHHAAYVLYLLTHPEKLALLLAEHIIEPAFRWLMRKGGGLVTKLLKHEVARGSDFERFIEDVLHDIL